jgi:hypothetical protein
MQDGCRVTIEPTPPDFAILGSTQKYRREVKPDFILVRQFVLALHSRSYLNTLLGLMFAAVPAVNSLQSILLSTQRAANIGQLREVQQRCAKRGSRKQHFPLLITELCSVSAC